MHPAALVNHILDYDSLFGPNVAGTAGLIRLALTDRQKGIDFVSSAAVEHFVEVRERFDEESPLIRLATLSRSYANGYGASKWAAELLLNEASERFGLPVNVFRGDMILPHRTMHEQINVDDVFARLLFSVIATGLAPVSFYTRESDGSKARAHYDGLPVDFVAGAVAGIGAWPHTGICTYNVTNHADDGLSLDVFVDWIEDVGYAVERVNDYEEWLRRFEVKLRALPEDKRQVSALHVFESLRRPMDAGRRAPGSGHFDEALRKLEIGPDTPRLNNSYIIKCLDDLGRLGLITRPDSLRESAAAS